MRKKHYRSPSGLTNEERFELYVDYEPTSGCHLWNGSTTRDGYGNFGWKFDDGSWLTVRAHRKSYEMNYGPIPEGLVICHKCNNPACVNPEHLYAGTQRQNIEDAIRAGTHVLAREGYNAGTRNGRARLTEDDVRKMRAEYAAGGTSFKKIGEKYGVRHYAARAAIIGETWSTVR